jgi:5-methylcytosine-specific restriction endonuclease McrA
VAPSSGRRGRPWERLRRQVLADTAGVCWICGHPGAGDVDHDPPYSTLIRLGLDPEDPAHIRGAAHGALSRCPTCGRCCNQAKGNRPHQPTAASSRAW